LIRSTIKRLLRGTLHPDLVRRLVKLHQLARTIARHEKRKRRRRRE